jgi:superfamily II DNA or RNA helicase
LTLDSTRNDLICRTVADYDGDGINLILTDRKAHCLTLAKILKADYGIQAEVLTGDTKDREAVISRIRKYLIATSQLIGEGFDLPAISSIFLATPVKYHGRLIQYIGRALRPAPGKTRAMIFDFVDCLNPVFLASAKSRSYTYQNQNILEERG